MTEYTTIYTVRVYAPQKQGFTQVLPVTLKFEIKLNSIQLKESKFPTLSDIRFSNIHLNMFRA